MDPRSDPAVTSALTMERKNTDFSGFDTKKQAGRDAWVASRKSDHEKHFRVFEKELGIEITRWLMHVELQREEQPRLSGGEIAEGLHNRSQLAHETELDDDEGAIPMRH